MTARLRRDPAFVLAAAILGAWVAVALLAPQLAPYPSDLQLDLTRLRESAPSAAHWFGTDGVSRDVLSRLLVGARVTLLMGAIAVGTSLGLGVLWGSAAALSPLWLDRLLMRTIDACLAFPRLVLLLSVAAAFGQLPPIPLAVVLGATGWFGTARLVRAELRALAERSWVVAARALGAPEPRILRRHVLPALVGPLAVAASLALAAVVPLEAGLTFLGFGVRAPAASWGSLLAEAADRPDALWWMVLFPALALVSVVASATVVGDRLRRHFDLGDRA
ncbi:MAG: ABC transporter permease [Gemmatimonadaceae bacterium]|nr:ABC transporter permease [Gemmatimonadaceae bacterium]